MSEMSVLHEKPQKCPSDIQISGFRRAALLSMCMLENTHGDSTVCLLAVFPVDSLS